MLKGVNIKHLLHTVICILNCQMRDSIVVKVEQEGAGVEGVEVDGVCIGNTRNQCQSSIVCTHIKTPLVSNIYDININQRTQTTISPLTPHTCICIFTNPSCCIALSSATSRTFSLLFQKKENISFTMPRIFSSPRSKRFPPTISQEYSLIFCLCLIPLSGYHIK